MSVCLCVTYMGKGVDFGTSSISYRGLEAAARVPGEPLGQP